MTEAMCTITFVMTWCCWHYFGHSAFVWLWLLSNWPIFMVLIG